MTCKSLSGVYLERLLIPKTINITISLFQREVPPKMLNPYGQTNVLAVTAYTNILFTKYVVFSF
jgi:hypothetical protein